MQIRRPRSATVDYAVHHGMAKETTSGDERPYRPSERDDPLRTGVPPGSRLGPVAAQQPVSPDSVEAGIRRRSTSLSNFSMIPPSVTGWISGGRRAIRRKPPRWSPSDAIYLHRLTTRPDPAASSIPRRSPPKPAWRVQAGRLRPPAGTAKPWTDRRRPARRRFRAARLRLRMAVLARHRAGPRPPVREQTGNHRRTPARRHDKVRHRIRAGDRLRAGKHRSVPAVRVASPAQKRRARLSAGLSRPAPVPGDRPLPSGPQSRAFPHHSGDDTPSTLLVLQARPVRRMVRVRLHHRRTVQPPGRLKGSPPDPRLHPWPRLARHRPGKHLANPRLIKRPAKPHRRLAALRLLHRTLAPVGCGSHAALLACDGRCRPAHGDPADATLGQPPPPPTRHTDPAADPSPPPSPLPPASWPSAWNVEPAPPSSSPPPFCSATSGTST